VDFDQQRAKREKKTKRSSQKRTQGGVPPYGSENLAHENGRGDKTRMRAQQRRRED